MNQKHMSKETQEFVRDVTAALKRAGESARRPAFQTQTNLVVVRNGKKIIEVPKAPK